MQSEIGLSPVFRHPLVLASGSPRRAEILRSVGWPFTTVVPDIDESCKPDEGAVAYVERLALAKAEAVALKIPRGALVLGADTTVVKDSTILGKPTDAEDARRMLRLLSGSEHDVITGVALVNSGPAIMNSAPERQTLVGHESTRVQFVEITDAELEWYVQTDEPMDKAGAYAAQGSAALFIERIEGDYWNVVGLPICLVYKLAKQIIR